MHAGVGMNAPDDHRAAAAALAGLCRIQHAKCRETRRMSIDRLEGTFLLIGFAMIGFMIGVAI